MNVNTRRQAQGYTLIELLIALTVISILAALLMGAFSQARERARQTQCVHHLRQIGAAFQTYLQDWEALPESFEDVRNNPYPRAKDSLKEYSPSPEIYHCPSSPEPKLLRDYVYRGETLEIDGAPPIKGKLRMTSDSVLLYCANHLTRDEKRGNWLALRAGGSVRSIPAGKVVYWAYVKDRWYAPPYPESGGQREVTLWPVFPGESMPPDIEPLDLTGR